jgi:hypothetical protein
MANTHAAATCPREADVVMFLTDTVDRYDVPSIRHHLKSCLYCQATANETDGVLAELDASVAPIQPPAALRDRVLGKAADTLTPVEPTPITAARSARHSRPGGSRLATFAAAAAAVCVVAAGAAWNVQTAHQRDAATAQAGTLADVLSQIVRLPHAVLVDRGGRPLTAVAVDGPTLRVYDLGLPAPTDGRTWTLWGLRGADATRLGTLPDGTLPATGNYEAYGVSQEPTATDKPGVLEATGPVAPPSS